MGSLDDDKLAFGAAHPQFDCQLIQESYLISRYPVTVAQFSAFVEGEAYQQREYWTEAGWEWRQGKGVFGPEEFSAEFKISNHPQVGVSWYEAVAFCRWLSQLLGYRVRLPTEAQWERAARHTDGRSYPWKGDLEVSHCCNMVDTGIDETSAVGIFPSGNAECGAADMAGNVWEWCNTKWTADYQRYETKVDERLEGGDSRVLRGGAFHYLGFDVRCAYRYGFDPDYRNSNIGFRVVASPSALDSEPSGL